MITRVSHLAYKFAGISLLRVFDLMVAVFTANKAVLTTAAVPFDSVLHDNCQIFLDEYRSMLASKELHNIKDFYKVETDINYDENWKAAPLILFGYLFKENAARCPNTIRIITQMPGCCGAMFSVLAPGKHIPPHRGIYKGIYRCLLTLYVEPNADCWIKVNNEKFVFKVGESIYFDETAEHEVMNASSSARVVLYLDFYRKFPFPLNLFNNFVFSLLQKSRFVNTIFQEYAKLEPATTEKLPFSAPILK